MSKHTDITLAMDLSMNSPGFAVVSVVNGIPYIMETSVVKSSTKDNHGTRLIIIENEIKRYIDKYEPKHYVREKGFSRFNNVTQILYKVMGLSEYAVAKHGEGVSIHEIPVTTVKKEVTGRGNAKKDEVGEHVLKLYRVTNLEPLTDKKGVLIDDKTDALAVGYAFLKQKKLVK